MRRMWIAVLFSIFSQVLASRCVLAQSAGPSEINVIKKCSVNGRVVTAAEGAPLKSARVVLMPEDSRSEKQLYATSSDADGSFVLKDVLSGHYRFFASHPGFVEQHYKARNYYDGPIFTLRDGEEVKGVLFRMTRTAVITGRISNEDGEPMIQVQVTALRQPDKEDIDDETASAARKHRLDPASAAQSDDRGQYRIFGLKPGEYYIRADDAFEPVGHVVDESYWVRQEVGSEYASVYYPGVTQVGQAQPIPLRAGDEVEADVLLRRVKTVEVSGRVLDATGPSRHAFVRLEPVDGIGGEFDRQDNTDENGNFRLRSVSEGTYFIYVYQRGEQDRVYETRTRQKVEAAGENVELTIRLGAGATIPGRVTVSGSTAVSLDRIEIALASVDEEEPFGGRALVRKDASFEIKSVQDGNYAVKVWGLEHGSYVRGIRYGPDDELEKGVQVGSGATAGKLEVTISSNGAQLEGSVTDDNDAPVIGAHVRISPDPLTAYNRFRRDRTTTDQRGHFSFADLSPGKYVVQAKGPRPGENRSIKSEPQPVTLSETDHQTIQLKLTDLQR
jgi:protocatechuate 3,4-dioxygenase beta subunit